MRALIAVCLVGLGVLAWWRVEAETSRRAKARETAAAARSVERETVIASGTFEDDAAGPRADATGRPVMVSLRRTGGGPVAGASVELRCRGQVVAQGRTDADGVVELRHRETEPVAVWMNGEAIGAVQPDASAFDHALGEEFRWTVRCTVDGQPGVPNGVVVRGLNVVSLETSDDTLRIVHVLTPAARQGKVVFSAPGYVSEERDAIHIARHRRDLKVAFHKSGLLALYVLGLGEKRYTVEYKAGSTWRVVKAFGTTRVGSYRARLDGTGFVIGEVEVDGSATLEIDQRTIQALVVHVAVPAGTDPKDASLELDAARFDRRYKRVRPKEVEKSVARFELAIPGDRTVTIRPRHPQLLADPARPDVQVTNAAGEVTLRMVGKPRLRFRVLGKTPTSMRVLLYRNEERVFHGGLVKERDGWAIPVDEPGRYDMKILVRRRPAFFRADIDVGWDGRDLGAIDLGP